jgi:hypothetical protein
MKRTNGRTNGTGTYAKLEEQQELIDRQRGEVTSTRTRHARELAELVARQVLEERDLERKHRRELARLWMHHRRKMGRWILGVREDHQAAAAELDPEGR